LTEISNSAYSSYSAFLLHREILIKMGKINKKSCAELYFWISWTEDLYVV